MPSASKLSAKEQVRLMNRKEDRRRERVFFDRSTTTAASDSLFCVLDSLCLASSIAADRAPEGRRRLFFVRIMGVQRSTRPRTAPKPTRATSKKTPALELWRRRLLGCSRLIDEFQLTPLFLSFSLFLFTQNYSTMPSSASSSTPTTRPSSSTLTTSARGSSWTSAG